MQDSRYVQHSNLHRLETSSEVAESKRVRSGDTSNIGRLFVLDLSSGELKCEPLVGTLLPRRSGRCQHLLNKSPPYDRAARG
jgi:hypothetical protein